MHTIFRKGTLAALVIGLILGVVGLSQANYSIRQNPDGTTDWVDPSVDRFGVGGNPEVRVGRHYITLRLSDVTSAQTHFIVSPISGVLFSAFIVHTSDQVHNTTSTLTFGVMSILTPNNFIHPTTGAGFYIVASQANGTVAYNRAATIGQVLNAPNGRTPVGVTRMEGQPRLREGGIISIGLGGEAADALESNQGRYDIIIIIDPR